MWSKKVYEFKGAYLGFPQITIVKKSSCLDLTYYYYPVNEVHEILVIILKMVYVLVRDIVLLSLWVTFRFYPSFLGEVCQLLKMF